MATMNNNMQPMNQYFAQKVMEWKRTGKKKYEIWCSLPFYGAKIHNHLEDSDYIVDATKSVVLSGTAGEQWTTSIDKVAKTYTFATGETINQQSLVRRLSQSGDGWMKIATTPGPMMNYAMLLDKAKFKNVPIATSWGTILIANRSGIKHGDGDYLVCSMNQDGSPNFNDMWVVNGAIFPATYNVQNFNLSQKAKLHAANDAPRPKPITDAESIYTYLRQFRVQNVNPFAHGSSLIKNNKVLYERLQTNMPYRTIPTKNKNIFLVVYKDLTYCTTVVKSGPQGLECMDITLYSKKFKPCCGMEMENMLKELQVI